MERERLLNVLATELERPRTLSSQVIQHLTGTYDLEREAVGSFLDTRMASLEEYQVDLVLSPLFTPQLSDQAVVAGLLGAESVPKEAWPSLIQELLKRPTRARLVTEDGTVHEVELREVILERFVNRLRLGAVIPEPLLGLITGPSSGPGRPLLTAIARRAVWEKGSRREILFRYLTADMTAAEGSRVEDAVDLLKLVETYEPEDVADLLRRIPGWEQVLQQEISSAGSPKPFFNERVEDLHGGGRDQRRHDTARVESRQRELAFLKRLRFWLESPAPLPAAGSSLRRRDLGSTTAV